MAAITTRSGKGSPLTNAEMDANLTSLNESQTVMGEPMGHADKTQSSISFDAGTRTFTISPVGANFVVWCKGEKYTYTTAQTVVIPDTDGLHYIYFSSTGVLSTKMSFFTWDEDSPTAYVYWNATLNEAIYFADERHGVTLDWQTHEYLHRTRGAAIANGFTISGYTTSGTGSSNADAQVTIEGGTFFDEDMQVDIVSTNTPTANTWQQDLSSPAQIPVLYLDGSAWKITTANDYPVKKGTLIQYNLYSGGSWSVVDVNSGEFTVSWILATNNLNHPVLAVLNQSATNTIGQAEELVFEDLTLPGFPSVEFRPLYRLIFQSANSYTNATKAKLVGVQDLRSISAAGVAPALVSDHGNLSGLTDDDHPQYLSTSDVRAGITAAVKKSLIPSTPVAGGVAYGTADSLDFSAAGTAGQVLTSGGASVPTWTSSTSANTALAIVQRDSNGDFSAGTITVSGLSNSGNLAFTGTGNRITADFSNGTIASRAMLQTSSPNENTLVYTIPNGTATSSGFGGFNSSTPANSSSWYINATSTEVAVVSNKTGTGSYLPINFYAGGSLRFKIDTDGKVIFGDGSPGSRFTVKATGVSQETLFDLQAATSSTPLFGVYVNQITNLVSFFTAASTDLAFKPADVEKMRLFVSGGLGLGTTTDPGAGAIYATGNITAYYSDERLKTKLGNIENALDKVRTLDGFYYEANQTAQDLGYEAVREVGVSAQQVQAVQPEVVAPAAIDQQYLTVRYERLVPLLIEAIKELSDKVIVLEEKLKEGA